MVTHILERWTTPLLTDLNSTFFSKTIVYFPANYCVLSLCMQSMCEDTCHGFSALAFNKIIWVAYKYWLFCNIVIQLYYNKKNFFEDCQLRFTAKESIYFILIYIFLNLLLILKEDKYFTKLDLGCPELRIFKNYFIFVYLFLVITCSCGVLIPRPGIEIMFPTFKGRI